VICLAIFSPRLLHDRGIAPLDPPALGPLKAEPFAHRYRINVAAITPVFFQPLGSVVHHLQGFGRRLTIRAMRDRPGVASERVEHRLLGLSVVYRVHWHPLCLVVLLARS